MSLAQFDNGYWYATELRRFAIELGLSPVSGLRKDQLEALLRDFLHTGGKGHRGDKAHTKRAQGSGRSIVPARSRSKRNEPTDLELGLSLQRRIRNYVGNRETKDFIERQAKRLTPDFKKRSGARYRLNRWREEQLALGRPITYGDLVRRYIELNAPAEKYARIPVGRYINFVADFKAKEDGATHARAVAAWQELKKLDIPKDYASWRKHRQAKPKRGRS